ncbi:MAG TPA: VCBS repeat-containing protein [Methanomicrobia archaeon]|nr:VCBS repeat-containing protein [Methanomicrobia archaeon]
MPDQEVIQVDTQKRLRLLATIAITVCLLPLFPLAAAVEPGNLILEHTELWLVEQGQVADICATDLDGDGTVEIVTIGSLPDSAELRISHWNGATYTLLTEVAWQEGTSRTLGRAVHCADVDGDGVVEILSVTYVPDLEDSELRIWHWDSATNALVLQEKFGLFEDPPPGWTTEHIYDLAAGDVDSDGEVEIVLAGSAYTDSTYGIIRILTWDGSAVTEEHSETWGTSGTTAFGVALGDVDGDSVIEIVTAGDTADYIDLRVWRWDGAAMTLEAGAHWKTMESSSAVGLAIGDLDGDGLLELVTAGRAIGSMLELDDPFFGLITVWDWDGVEFDLEAYEAWQSARGNVEFFAAAAEDVDLDGVKDAIAVGAVHETPGANVLRVYSWDGLVLQNKYSEEWIGPEMMDSFAYTTYSRDVDGDGIVEILTGGAWSWPGSV